ncbi:MAG TPA: hypothetical protein P5555_01045 [Candidatus Paceibacterota bacterium]|nr:hypothetical protein [Verrucomicrobiota bacterium]HRZ43759.1 hypothetical protein [Candidatus Paceibacterota bacterium]
MRLPAATLWFEVHPRPDLVDEAAGIESWWGARLLAEGLMAEALRSIVREQGPEAIVFPALGSSGPEPHPPPSSGNPLAPETIRRAARFPLWLLARVSPDYDPQPLARLFDGRIESSPWRKVMDRIREKWTAQGKPGSAVVRVLEGLWRIRWEMRLDSAPAASAASVRPPDARPALSRPWTEDFAPWPESPETEEVMRLARLEGWPGAPDAPALPSENRMAWLSAGINLPEPLIMPANDSEAREWAAVAQAFAGLLDSLVPSLSKSQTGGLLIAGGDEFLAALPPADAIETARECWDRWSRQRWMLQGERVGFSAGIAIGPRDRPASVMARWAAATRRRARAGRTWTAGNALGARWSARSWDSGNREAVGVACMDAAGRADDTGHYEFPFAAGSQGGASAAFDLLDLLLRHGPTRQRSIPGGLVFPMTFFRQALAAMEKDGLSQGSPVEFVNPGADGGRRPAEGKVQGNASAEIGFTSDTIEDTVEWLDREIQWAIQNSVETGHARPHGAGDELRRLVRRYLEELAEGADSQATRPFRLFADVFRLAAELNEP